MRRPYYPIVELSKPITTTKGLKQKRRYRRNTGEKIKVAAYIRVSTLEQSRGGYSLGAQLERLRCFCKAKGWKIVNEYVEDGCSGRDVNRPAYQKMIESRSEWDLILVTRMDRIHRNLRNFTAMMDDLKKWGKEFTSIQESLDTSTAIGRFVSDIIQRISQLESEQIGERVYEGMKQKALTGAGLNGFQCPYGYYFRRGRLVIHNEESKVIGMIYRNYLDLKSSTKLAAKLRKKGYPTKKGGRWAPRSVCKILRNPIYCGYLRWDGIIYKDFHKAIIGIERFNRVQELLDSNIRNHKRKRDTILIEE